MQQSVLPQTPQRQHHTQLSSLPSNPNAEPAIPKCGKFQFEGARLNSALVTCDSTRFHTKWKYNSPWKMALWKKTLLFKPELPPPKRISFPCYCWQPKGEGNQVGNIQVHKDLPALSLLSTSFSQPLCLDKENSTKSVKSFEFLRQKKFWKG